MRESKYRFLILRLIMLCMLVAIAVRLFNMQIIDGEKYRESVSARLVTNVVKKAARGDITDKYGRVLVTNKSGYSVLMQKTASDDGELNAALQTVVEILDATGDGEYADTLPVSKDCPYSFVFEDKNGDGSNEDEKQEWLKNSEYYGEYLNDASGADEVLTVLAQAYGVEGDISSRTVREVIGIRYDAEQKQFSAVNPLTVAENINAEAVTRIKELQDSLPGISVSEDYVRSYAYPGLATQLLGRVGRISAEEYEKNSSKGYGMNDTIGKQGIERWAESYLRGTDGAEGKTATVDGREVEISADTDPVPGNYVMLTLDADLQSTLENSLASTVKSIGGDCNAGAAVVLDVNTGDTLAMGSYPTYDMSRFDEDYESLVNNPGNPMINRAVSGLYSPGSTFKPLTAIAGIQSGNLKLNERISCEGVYKFYTDYQPTCWIWSEARATHGSQDVTLAIENSCNYFFYELGRRIGIDTLDEYAKKFGLGEYTGVQLTEEAEGHMASPEYKKQVVENVIDSGWFDGDTLQAAIGQSYSLFTPIQLANYCAALANGGTRYKVNIIDSIRSSVDGSVVEKFDPEVVENLDISEDTMSRILDGMKKVVDEGSASSIFAGYPIQVGGKTGTAQIGSGSNNAIFIAFAPFEKPEIAVAVVLEHGVRGTNAGRVARDVFDKYFFGSGDAAATAQPDAAQADTAGTSGAAAVIR